MVIRHVTSRVHHAFTRYLENKYKGLKYGYDVANIVEKFLDAKKEKSLDLKVEDSL